MTIGINKRWKITVEGPDGKDHLELEWDVPVLESHVRHFMESVKHVIEGTVTEIEPG